MPSTQLHRRRARAGFSLVEVSVAMCVVVVALSALVSSLIASSGMHRVSSETAIAQRAAVQLLERMQGAPFDEVYRAYNATAADDGGLTVAAPGANFAAPGLDALPGDADGLCGQVQFPDVDVAGVLQLREDVVDGDLGMPRDLDLDGLVDGADHGSDYVLLPVRIVVRWRGVSGVRELELESVLCER